MTKISNNQYVKIQEGFEDDLHNEDSELFEAVGNYITGKMDIEDVHNDPAYDESKISVDSMIEYYKNNKGIKTENEKFIKEAFTVKEEYGTKTTNEINSIKTEIKENKLNDITAEWVREWHEKKQKSVRQSVNSEPSDFVKSSMNADDSPIVLPTVPTRKVYSRREFVRYASLAAAALAGVFMIIRILIPSSDPGAIFNSYYKPFDALSGITRSMKIEAADSYASAIARYKNGDYATAFGELSAIAEKAPDQESIRYYMGLSLVGLQKYTQAIPILSEVSAKQGEFGKEAQWYLGLAYLKISDEKKARQCFENLSRSEGYYRERSEKILRRLK